MIMKTRNLYGGKQQYCKLDYYYKQFTCAYNNIEVDTSPDFRNLQLKSAVKEVLMLHFGENEFWVNMKTFLTTYDRNKIDKIDIGIKVNFSGKKSSYCPLKFGHFKTCLYSLNSVCEHFAPSMSLSFREISPYMPS